MQEILSKLAEQGVLGIILAVLLYYLFHIETTHKDERSEWMKMAKDQHHEVTELTKNSHTLLTEIKTLISLKK